MIAGLLGGRRLVAPKGMDTRPTSDRVREALFSALGDVTGARVLDLYAGTGALAIEALSRGAARATLVENARPALAALRENLTSLALLDRARVLAQPAARAVAALAAGEETFDLVFVDPPYADLPAVLPLLEALATRALAPGGRVVLEHASRDRAPGIAGLTALRSKAYGDTTVTLYERDEA